MYSCTPKALYNHVEGLSSTTTSVQHPLGWLGCHRTTAPVRSPQHPTGGKERESHRANQVYALTTHQLQVERRERVIEPIKCMRTPHTSYRWRGERDIEPIKCMRSPHTSYRWRGERDIGPIKCMGIIWRPWWTRGSGENLSSHPKDGAFWQYSVPVTILVC